MSGIPEYAVVAALLEKSAGGIRYSDTALTRDIRRRVKKLDRAEGIVRIQWLFSILDRLGHARETSVIAPLPVGNGVSREHRTTLDKIGHYLTEHFRDTLTLERLAREIGMNPSALCRHFRPADRKNSFRRTERNPYQPCLSPAAGYATGHLCHRLGIGICQPVPFQPPVQVADWPNAGRIPEKYPE